MAIKVIAQRREVKLGKNPGMKFVVIVAAITAAATALGTTSCMGFGPF